MTAWALHWCLISYALAWLPPPEPLVLQPREISRQRRHAKETRLLEIHGWVTELSENLAFHAPLQDECQFYTGRILGEISSYVALTECEGQHYGLIQVQGKEYTLEPQDKGSHVLRRREAHLKEEIGVAKSFNLTGDTVEDLEMTFDNYDEAIEYDDIQEDEPTHFQDVQIVSRPLTGPNNLWLELAVVADDTLVHFHGRARVRHYVLALMNIVSAIFNDPSLSANMTLVINKLFLEDKNRNIIKPNNAKKSLEAVNKWNYRHLMKLPYDSSGWDAAVWLTRADLGGPSGFAPVGGVCARTRSAALDREEGLTSAFVIAHELAHLLGLTHDGDGSCDADARRGSVMAPTVTATLHEYAWSSCSRDQFHQYSKSWYCMQQRSSAAGISLGGASELGNYVFTMDEQCRTEFGEGFSVCKTVRSRAPCARLWCQEEALPQVCRTKRAPPLDGTPCAAGHWCVSGYCEPISRQLSGSANETSVLTEVGGSETELVQQEKQEIESPVEGGWSEWSDWGECGASCGYSLRSRHRYCNNPLPSGGGSECSGLSSEAQVCWTGRECFAGVPDVRAQLCRRVNTTLIPYFHTNAEKWCHAWCVDSSGGPPVATGVLPDETPCDYDHRYNLCYQGACVAGACAGADPGCALCPGGSCHNSTSLYTRRLTRGWTRIAIIPHEATKLHIHMQTPEFLRFALKERGKPALELNLHQTKKTRPEEVLDPEAPMNMQLVQVQESVAEEYEGRLVSSGTVINWTISDRHVDINSRGPLADDLMILAIQENETFEDQEEILVSVNYSTPIRREQPFSWRTEYGPCSASCGGGVRAARARCHPPHRCPAPAAPAAPAAISLQPCNTHRCEWVWSAGPWEECSATCGQGGVQERMLYCVPATSSIRTHEDVLREFVSPALCAAPAPGRTQPCNRLPCPAYWRELPWTECSAECGRGWSRRPLLCPAPVALCGPRPAERRRRCRARRCPHRAACRKPDDSQYCSLRSLARACQLPPFRKLCCNSCKQFQDSRT